MGIGEEGAVMISSLIWTEGSSSDWSDSMDTGVEEDVVIPSLTWTVELSILKSEGAFFSPCLVPGSVISRLRGGGVKNDISDEDLLNRMRDVSAKAITENSCFFKDWDVS